MTEKMVACADTDSNTAREIAAHGGPRIGLAHYYNELDFLLFSSGANLVIPFVLYLLSKRYRASAVLAQGMCHCNLGFSRLSYNLPPDTMNSNCIPSNHPGCQLY